MFPSNSPKEFFSVFYSISVNIVQQFHFAKHPFDEMPHLKSQTKIAHKLI
jgi:hypothetical protein